METERQCLRYNHQKASFPVREPDFSLWNPLQRTKEIGIRRVLGASSSGIVFLFSKEFIKWIFVSNLIAWPIAYYIMSRWLRNFAFRTNLGIWIFIQAMLLSLIIAILTVIYRSIKTAMANPANTLRYE
jgi:putative ABC transport system permease protein